MLEGDGFCFVGSGSMRSLLAAHGSLTDWPTFAASWDDLGADSHLAETGRHRLRRHAVFHASGRGAIARQPHQPHFQSPDYNRLQGGIERWFEPILPAVANGACMQAALHLFRHVCSTLSPAVEVWHIEVHQFRIEPGKARTGEPTPEGIHRDGVDYVLAMLVGRRNLRHGTTTVHDMNGQPLGASTLREPLDALWVDDRRVMHGVTPVVVQRAAEPAHRDVLVITGRCLRTGTSQNGIPA